MDGTGDQFLAGAALPGDNEREDSRGGQTDLLEILALRRAGADRRPALPRDRGGIAARDGSCNRRPISGGPPTTCERWLGPGRLNCQS